MIDYSLRQLEYFVAVARVGSISEAARSLGVSSAAVAASVGKLEDLCQLLLFDRYPAQGVQLTPVGRQFLEEAQQVLGQARQLRSMARGLSEQTSGHLRFGCYYVLSYLFGPLLLGAHRERWPHVTVEVLEGHIEVLGEQLERGEADLVLSYGEGLSAERFDLEELVRVKPRVVLPAAHPLARQKDVALQDLRGIPYLWVREPGRQVSFPDMLREAGVDPEIALVSRSYEMVRSCVGRGLGYTLMAFQPPNPLSYHGDAVVSLPIRDPMPELRIVVASAKGRMEAPLVRGFADLCRDVVRAP